MPIFDSNAIPTFRKPLRITHRTKALAGKRFGKLVAIGFLGVTDDARRRATWLFQCDCGNFYYTSIDDVLNGRIVSCGCKSRSGENRRTHGMAHTRIYNTWSGMISRIENQTSLQFHDYGGRGIQICQHLRQFTGFMQILGMYPSTEYSIDRINHNGNYSCGSCPQCIENGWPLNVRWADKWEQAANKRNNHSFTINNETFHIAEWCRRTGVPRSKVMGRIKLGWTPEEIFEFIPRRTSTQIKKKT